MKTIGAFFITIVFACNLAFAQDTLYIFKSGAVVTKRALNDIDSVIFYKPISSSGIIDIDGNLYHTVTIGTQEWMVENLKTTKFNDGTDIPIVSDNTNWSSLSTSGCCFYNNDVANKSAYGVLYNWYTVNTGKLAPSGWHVPTDAEWTTLENYLTNNGYGYEGSGGDVAKSLAATSGWNIVTDWGAIGNDLTKNNTSGFSALPSGFRDINGAFYHAGSKCYIWSLTGNTESSAFVRNLFVERNDVIRNVHNKQYGESVRCIRDY
jgi:uncharacterized protein (TIGR02145 family)